MQKQITLGLSEKTFVIFDWGSYAVDLFFLLSGFVMNWVYCSNIKNEFSWRKYYIARFARIIPIYQVTLIPFLPFFFIVFSKYGFLHDNCKYLKVFLGNIFILSGFFKWNNNYWILNNPSWSISIELFAYAAIFPFLRHFKYKLGTYYNLTFIFLGILGMYLCYTVFQSEFLTFDIAHICRGLFGFIIGFFICSIWCRKYISNLFLIDASIIFIIMLFGLCIFGIISKINLEIVLPLLVFFTAFDKGYVCSFLKVRLLQWLGERSYSIYLWHWPIVYLMFVQNKDCSYFSWVKNTKAEGICNLLMLLAIIFMISEISYKYFESPIRKYARTL